MRQCVKQCVSQCVCDSVCATVCVFDSVCVAMMLGLKVAVTSLCALLVGWCVMVLVEPNCLDAEFRHGAVAADTDTCSKIGR